MARSAGTQREMGLCPKRMDVKSMSLNQGGLRAHAYRIAHAERIVVKNPASGEELCTYVLLVRLGSRATHQSRAIIHVLMPIHRIISSSQEDVQTAVHNANAVFEDGIWSRAPAIQRAAVLSDLARGLEARIPDLAKIESLQTGRAIREMTAQVRELFACLLCMGGSG